MVDEVGLLLRLGGVVQGGGGLVLLRVVCIVFALVDLAWNHHSSLRFAHYYNI